MDMEYNDYQILSPDKMEFISKKYFEKMKELEIKQNEIKTQKKQKCNEILFNLNTKLAKTYIMLEKFCKYCEYNHIKNRKQNAYEVQKDILEIASKIPFENTQITDENKYNYCSLIYDSIFNLCDCVTLCFEIEKENVQEINNFVDETQNTLIKDIKKLSALFVYCKYRN